MSSGRRLHPYQQALIELLKIDYRIHYQGANGVNAPKLFKLTADDSSTDIRKPSPGATPSSMSRSGGSGQAGT